MTLENPASWVDDYDAEHPREYDILALQDKINEDIRRLAALTPYRHTVLHNRVFVEGYIPQELPLCDRLIPAEGQE